MANLNVRITEKFEKDIVERANEQSMDKSEYVRSELMKDKNEIINKLTNDLDEKELKIEDLQTEYLEKMTTEEANFKQLLEAEKASCKKKLTEKNKKINELQEQHEKKSSNNEKEIKQLKDEYIDKIEKIMRQNKEELQKERERIENNFYELLDNKDKQIEKLTTLLDQEQQLQLVTQNKNDKLQIELDNYEDKKWWHFWK